MISNNFYQEKYIINKVEKNPIFIVSINSKKKSKK